MATNYTTKTASLKATTADIRKLQADTLSVKDEKGEYVDVMDAIDKASEEAVAAAGIHVGTETSMVNGDNLNVDAGGDGYLDAGIRQKVKGMNFCGNVAVVNNDDGTVDFWFMNPDDNTEPTTVAEGSAPNTAMYVYSGATANIDGLTAGNQHSRCIANSAGTPTYTLSGNGRKDASGKSTMTAFNKTTFIKVVIQDGDGTVLKTVSSPAICEENTSTKTRGGSITTNQDGVSISITNVINNIVNASYNDAKDNYTPGYVRFSAKVTTTTSTILGTNGGTYKVLIYLNDGTSGATDTKIGSTSGIIYSYKSDTLTAADAPSATITYHPSSTDYISGIQYDTAASVKLNVSGIKGTQRGGAHKYANTKRAKLTTAITGTCGVAFSVGDIGNIGASENTTATAYDAIFSGYLEDTCDRSKTTTTNEPAKVSITAAGEVKSYEQGGSESPNAKCTPVVSISQTNFLYDAASSTSTTTWKSGTPINITFTRDGSRKLGTLATIKAGTEPGTYTSSETIADSGKDIYKEQILVQGGGIRHPKTDVTEVYKSTASGTRYYVVPVSFNTTGVTKLTVTAGGIGTTFNNATLRIYLVGVKGNVKNSMCLNWYNGFLVACQSATGGAIPVADVETPSNNSWAISTDPSADNGGFPIDNTSGYKYYLVVEMLEGFTGKLTSLKLA